MHPTIAMLLKHYHKTSSTRAPWSRSRTATCKHNFKAGTIAVIKAPVDTRLAQPCVSFVASSHRLRRGVQRSSRSSARAVAASTPLAKRARNGAREPRVDCKSPTGGPRINGSRLYFACCRRRNKAQHQSQISTSTGALPNTE